MKWLLIVLVLFMGGCLSSYNPETGETQHYIDPNVAQVVEDKAENVVGILTALSALFPAFVPIATAGGGALALWLKMKGKLTTVEADKDDFYRGGEILTMVLDEVKMKYPETWEKIKPRIEELYKQGANIETVIREFRHLTDTTTKEA